MLNGSGLTEVFNYPTIKRNQFHNHSTLHSSLLYLSRLSFVCFLFWFSYEIQCNQSKFMEWKHNFVVYSAIKRHKT